MSVANPQIMADAARIVERLRTTPVSLGALMDEYHCAYETMLRAILSQITRRQYRALAKKRLARGGVAQRFQKGHVTWNKGMKGWTAPGSEATQFQKGHIRGAAARKYRKIGTVTIRRGKPLSTQQRCRRRQSSRWIKIKDDGPLQDRYIPFSRYLWEKAHGPVPPGMFVVHDDNNLMNDSLDNLILVDRREHMRRLYARPTVIAKCRQRAAKASKRRHAQNRHAKKHARIQRRRATVVCECLGCGADLGKGSIQCPKCGGTAIESRKIVPMPDSVQDEVIARLFARQP